ncbi:MAG: DUF2934 domain-containing protein [Candidatus Binataceae bacterium]|nr:DUF2934 domain-containing protein [Candidatus Binataceae bacterium]
MKAGKISKNPKINRLGRKAADAFAGASNGATETPAESKIADSDLISLRAYELFLARGGIHGEDWRDWFVAERELAENKRSA